MAYFNDIVNDLNKYKEDEKFISFTLNVLKTNLNLIGVRTPRLKVIANKYKKESINDFIRNYSYETNFIYIVNLFSNITNILDYYDVIDSNSDLIDSWALTDSTYRYIKMPKTLSEGDELIDKLISSKKEFVIRYGYLLLFNYVKDDKNLKLIFNKIKDSDYYYVMMVEAWLLSYAFITNFDLTYDFLSTSNLSLTLKLKTISKCIDSYRIDENNKEKLKELRRTLKSI